MKRFHYNPEEAAFDDGRRISRDDALEQALRFRDVDKKEIKSALEIKLDKFDKIDEKYADYAKKVKDA